VSSILPPDSQGNKTHPREIRAAALDGILIAADSYRASERALGYYLRTAIAHGVTVDEACAVAQLDAGTVLRLTDPAVA
jgi:hypothetical protein